MFKILKNKKIKNIYKKLEYGFFFMLLMVMLFAFTKIRSHIGHAAVATFYPSTCLGGWENPTLAQGEPDVALDHEISVFDKTNSASITNSNAKIFCGAFVGEIPESTAPKSIHLSLSWAIKNIAVDAEPEAPTDNTELLDGVNQEQIQPEDLAPAPADASEVAPETPIEQGAPDAPADVPTEPEPQAFFWSPKIAYAEGFDVEQSTALIDVPVLDVPESIARISYTLDGVTWQMLGEVNSANWRQAAYDVPISNWSGLANLQVSIEMIPTIDTPPSIFLDALTLSVSYEPVNIVSTSDIKKLHVDKMETKGEHFSVTITSDSDQGEIMHFSGLPGTNLRFYNVIDPSFSITSAFGDDPVEMPTYQFQEGEFIAIDTKEKDACNDMTLAECRAAAGYIAGANFKITPTSDTPMEYRIKESSLEDMEINPETNPVPLVPTAETTVETSPEAEVVPETPSIVEPSPLEASTPPETPPATTEISPSETVE